MRLYQCKASSDACNDTWNARLSGDTNSKNEYRRMHAILTMVTNGPLSVNVSKRGLRNVFSQLRRLTPLKTSNPDTLPLIYSHGKLIVWK